MKKVITMLMAIVTSVAMSAQALVWDGSVYYGEFYVE